MAEELGDRCYRGWALEELLFKVVCGFTKNQTRG
jgi:hypothetical protein